MHFLREWYEKPTTHCATSFSIEFVMNCLQKYGNKYHDSENMISQLSQNDFSMNSHNNYVLESITVTTILTNMITVQDPEDQSVSERQQTLTTYFHELKK